MNPMYANGAGRDALGPGVSVKLCNVIGCKSEDQVSSSKLCKCNQGNKEQLNGDANLVSYLVGPGMSSLLSVLS